MLKEKEQMEQAPLQQETKEKHFLSFYEVTEPQLERNREVQNSRFRFWGVDHKDSQSMTNVKRAMHRVTALMAEPMPVEDEEFNTMLSYIESHYDALIGACMSYIDTHEHPRTASGKSRLHMVRNTLRMAQQESRQLRPQAEALHADHQQGLPWALLGSLRGMNIHLDAAEKVETAGAGTSDLLVITTKNHRAFFKSNEELRKPSEEIQENFIDKSKSIADKEIYTGLQKLLPNTEFDNNLRPIFRNTETRRLMSSDDPAERAAGFRELAQGLKDMGVTEAPDWMNAHVQELTNVVLERYEKWFTRYNLAGWMTAKIDDGRLLSTRNVATERLAQALGIQDLIATSKVATVISTENKTIDRGVAMAEAEGVDYGHVIAKAIRKERKVRHSPEAIRQLVCMQLFDTLCGQVDRNKSNLFAKVEKNKNGEDFVTGFQAIDNDICFGKLTIEELSTSDNGLGLIPRFADEEGVCQLQAMDGDLVTAILNLSEQTVRYTLGDLLQEDEIGALLQRLEGMKKVFRKTIEAHPEKIVASDSWDADVAQRFLRNDFHLEYFRANGTTDI